MDKSPRSEDFDPREVLAEIDGTSKEMVASSEAPRSFMVAFVALVATIFALLNVASWPIIYGLSALSIPLGVWYYLLMRKRPKPRASLSPSGAYVAYFFLLMLVLQFSRFWEPGSWGGVTAKWLALFVLLWFSLSGLRTAAMKKRLKDANESHR
ncbi:hypothetical protein F7P69_07130 [Cellulosimicrobium funkei]|nr:hypothetical protein [Cellulosimicrobium funkei]